MNKSTPQTDSSSDEISSSSSESESDSDSDGEGDNCTNARPEQNNPICSKCFEERTKTFALVPCGHNTFCGTCSSLIISGNTTQGKTCPTCSANVDFRMQTFN